MKVWVKDFYIRGLDEGAPFEGKSLETRRLTATSSKNASSRLENFKKNKKIPTLDTNHTEDGAMEVYPVTEVPQELGERCEN